MSDEFANAIEAGNGSGEAWNQKEQPVIIGTLLAKKSDQGPNKSRVYVVKEDGSEDGTSVWGGTVLDGHFDEIPVLSRVRVEFLGMKAGKNGKEYKDYSVKYIPNKDAQNVAEVIGEGSEAV